MSPTTPQNINEDTGETTTEQAPTDTDTDADAGTVTIETQDTPK